MKPLILAAGLAVVASPVVVAAPAEAQSRAYQRELRECNRELRRADSRKEYRRERRECRRELRQAERRDLRRYGRYNDHRYASGPRRYYADRDYRRYSRYDYNRYERGYNRYYADRYYRSGSYYPDRRLSWNDRVYRGQNGRYYCRRGDGTTGLIVGAGIGALLGNQINIGGSSTLRTIAGGAIGAALGQSIARGRLRCD